MIAIGEKLEKALAFYEKKEYKKAEKLADEMLATNPDFHRAWFLKGVILEETGKQPEADKHYEKAGSLYNMWFRLAMQLEKVDPERSMKYYERVLEMNPFECMALFNLGMLYEKAGNTAEALKYFNRIALGREILSKLIVPTGFMIFLFVGGIIMNQRGEKALSWCVLGMSFFCLFWLKRDAGTVMGMISKKREIRARK